MSLESTFLVCSVIDQRRREAEERRLAKQVRTQPSEPFRRKS